MGASSEYYLRLQEEEFNKLSIEEKNYLFQKGMEVRQRETENEDNDERYKKLKKARIDAWNDEQTYLFKKRNKMLGQ